MRDYAPILVAEDEEADVSILRMAAERAGFPYPLVVLPDGKEVIAYLEGAPPYTNRSQHPLPALILLDLKMPRMSGFDVLSWLTTRPELKDLPAVVLTSSSQDSDIAKARALGASDYHVKPNCMDDLINILKAVEKRWLSHPADTPPPHEIPPSEGISRTEI